MRSFKSSLDKTSIFISAMVILLSFGIACAVFVTESSKESGLSAYLELITPVFLLVLCTGAYLFSPLGITINSTEITINRKIKPVVISFNDIKTVRKLEPSDMKGAIRTMGNGGLWGYTGKYYNRKMGSMTFYCSQRENYILIELTSGKKVIITPDEPNELIAELKTQKPTFTIE